jgi:hypothetical protein
MGAISVKFSPPAMIIDPVWGDDLEGKIGHF